MRFIVVANQHEFFKFAVHDREEDEPLVFAMTERDANMACEALNAKYIYNPDPEEEE